jgi:hypothetical protein
VVPSMQAAEGQRAEARMEPDGMSQFEPGVGDAGHCRHTRSSLTTGPIVRAGRIAFGLICLALGVAGLFLPFLQGILLLVVGVTVLSRESDLARRWLDRLRAVALRRRAGDSGRLK